MSTASLFVHDWTGAARATISPCGTYRYSLFRSTGAVGDEHLLWVMLNPSTADATKDDPTIRKVVEFTRRAGYGGACVVNLFAFRATKPKDLRRAVRNHGLLFGEGPDNRAAIESAAATSAAIVCAWGAEPFGMRSGATGTAASRSTSQRSARGMCAPTRGRPSRLAFCASSSASSATAFP